MRVLPLQTDRLVVRPLTLGDADQVAALLPEARPGWLEWTVAGYEQLAALLQPPYGERGIALRETGRLVGLLGLTPSLGPFGKLASFGAVADAGRRRPEVGMFWAIAPAHRGNGYATEAAEALIRHAFAELDLARIVATTTYENQPSVAVMRRLGMRVEHNPDPDPEWFQVVGWLDHPGTARLRAAQAEPPASTSGCTRGRCRPPAESAVPPWP